MSDRYNHLCYNLEYLSATCTKWIHKSVGYIMQKFDGDKWSNNNAFSCQNLTCQAIYRKQQKLRERKALQFSPIFNESRKFSQQML